MNRLSNLDFAKGIAIILVILYHAGFLANGYLGVDVFLVVAGYLTARGILQRCESQQFSPVHYLLKRILRLLPLVLLAGLVSLSLGWALMLPDDFESVCDSVIASSFFANNVLQWITTRNYWAAINEVKPMMHFWYLGLLVQFYVMFVLLAATLKWSCKSQFKNCLGVVCSVLALTSIVLHFSSVGDAGCHFYFLPWRLFEFLLGAIVALWTHPVESKKAAWCALFAVFFVALVCLMPNRMGNSWRVAVMAFASSLFLMVPLEASRFADAIILRPILWCGRASLSLYVWHQVILAYTRYSLTDAFGIFDIAGMALALALLALTSYFLVEKKFLANHRGGMSVLAVAFLLINGWAFWGFLRAGVVRDVPELDVYVSSARRGLHSEYNDRIMLRNRPFSSEKKLKILVVGDSFARDWCNVLLESDAAEGIEVSYFRQVEPPEDCAMRVARADAIFYTTSGDFEVLPDYLGATNKIYVVGIKYFGNSNGQVYARRHTKDYFSAQVIVPDDLMGRNRRQAHQYGNHFIDIIKHIQICAGVVPVFSDEEKYISQDCRHLTGGGKICC